MKRYNVIAMLHKETRGIGIEGDLPWRIPQDLKNFKELTQGNSVIMGRKTWESLPKKYLENRLNIVITRNPENYSNKNIFFVKNFDEALEKCWDNKEIFVIGGQQIYEEAIKRRNCKKLFLTMVFDFNKKNFDTFFPDFENEFVNIKNYETNILNDIIWFQTEWLPKIVNPFEENYLNTMEGIISTKLEKNRTGVSTWSKFGIAFKFDLGENILPLQTTRRMWFRGIFEEFKWIISGSTNALKLADKGVKIWLGNTTREFLDGRGLTNYEVGDIGPTYGFNMRHYGAEYKGMNHDYTGKGVDQLVNVIETLKTDPTSRRMIIDLWNPSVIDKTALPPCMFCYTFNYSNGKLNLHVNQRSSDFFIARNWNDVFASLLLKFVAEIVGLQVGKIAITITNAHIYETHLNPVLTQIQRKPRKFPRLEIKKPLKSLEDILNLDIQDLELKNYNPYPSIKSEMIV